MVKRISSAILMALALDGCAPELDDRISLISSPRVIALAASPAEAEPTDAVTLRGLYVDPQGELPLDGSSWAFCIDRKPLTELGPIAPSCLAARGEGLISLGEGATSQGEIPMDACRLFGPDRPEPKAGEPAGRPVDPDPTGGYYQPFRVDIAGRFVSGAVRVRCGLGGATPAQAATFREQYLANEAPTLDSLGARRNGNTIEAITEDLDTTLKVRPGEKIDLQVSWPICTTSETCTGSESYLWFDPAKRTLETRREGIRISWFITAGTLEVDRTGRAEEEANINSSENNWTAPNASAIVSIWAVIRDDRGGVGWRGGKIRVE